MFGYIKAAPLMFLFLLVGTGCAVRHRPGGVDGPGVEGRVAFELLPDPDPATPTLSGQQVFLAPVPLEAPLPEYPKQALVNDGARVTVTVRIVAYEDGLVRDVLDSPLDQGTKNDDRKVFQDAVEQAVRSWRFKPATVRTLGEGEDLNRDGKVDYRETIEERPVRAYLELRFTFEVVNGHGRVQVEPSQ